MVTTIPATDPPDGLTEIVIASKQFSAFLASYSSCMVSDNIGVLDTMQRAVQGGEAIMQVRILRVMIINTALQVHSDALSHPDLQDILHSNHHWDLVIASPLFNELGVMIGNIFNS